MRILHAGNPCVVALLRALGHEVVVAAEDPEAAGEGPGRPFDVRRLWARSAPAPDLLLVVDELGAPALPYGLEDVPAPRLYWALDVHLNFFWQRHYARLFDLVLVAQRDYVPLFAAAGVPARWLPWGAEEAFLRVSPRARVHDVAFVGTVDAATRPKRAAALALLEARFAVARFGERPETRLAPAAMAEVFAASKIVFNEAVLGEVNFRVFEAMAAGALLLTEHVGNGLLDLFTPGEHLDVFTPETLLAKVEHHLAHDAARERIAAAGAALVRARHTLAARMAEIVALAERGIPRRDVRREAARHWGHACHLTVVRGLTHPGVAGRAAAESLRAALEDGDAAAAVALAEMLAWTGREPGALLALAEARRLEATNIRAWLLAADLERRRGDAAAATALVSEGVAAVPDLTPETRRRVLDALAGGIESAACLHALGLAMEEAGLPVAPGLVCREDAGLARTALDYHVRALAADPAHGAAAARAGAILEAAGMPDFAVQFYAAAVRAAPGDAPAREDLRRALAASYRPGKSAALRSEGGR